MRQKECEFEVSLSSRVRLSSRARPFWGGKNRIHLGAFTWVLTWYRAGLTHTEPRTGASALHKPCRVITCMESKQLGGGDRRIKCEVICHPELHETLF